MTFIKVNMQQSFFALSECRYWVEKKFLYCSFSNLERKVIGSPVILTLKVELAYKTLTRISKFIGAQPYSLACTL